MCVHNKTATFTQSVLHTYKIHEKQQVITFYLYSLDPYPIFLFTLIVNVNEILEDWS